MRPWPRPGSSPSRRAWYETFAILALFQVEVLSGWIREHKPLLHLGRDDWAESLADFHDIHKSV
jgi:hypothetical protein